MKCIKIAAHYMLSPDNLLRRWPLLTLSREGCLLDVEFFPKGVEERPFMQFFGGILTPAFIDIFSASPPVSQNHKEISPARHYARGTLVLGVDQPSHHISIGQSPPFYVKEQMIQKTSVEPWLVSCGNDVPIWVRMKQWALAHKNHNLELMLSSATHRGAQAAGIERAGTLVAGNWPGVLLLQNADLQQFKLNVHSTVKWLSVPSHFFGVGGNQEKH